MDTQSENNVVTESFNPTLSTNEIYRDNDTSRCLTDDLDAMDSIHSSLVSTYAAKNHAHSDYLTASDIASTRINNGDDLNNLMSEGVYYRAYSSSSTNTVANCPPSMYTSTFTLEVFKIGADGQILQRATRGHKTSRVTAERVYYQNSWGEWETVVSGGYKVLWSGNYYMTAGHTVNFSDTISNQANGAIFVWSAYENSTAKNFDFNYFFVPKTHVANHNGTGVDMLLSNSDMTKMGHKYLYVHDDKANGHEANGNITTVSGIEWKNNYYVLRYVLGC